MKDRRRGRLTRPSKSLSIQLRRRGNRGVDVKRLLVKSEVVACGRERYGRSAGEFPEERDECGGSLHLFGPGA